MAKTPKKPANPTPEPDNNIDEDLDTTEETRPETFEVAVLQAASERGLNNKKFDLIDIKWLWHNNYRINCYADRKIIQSHFISYSKTEGIYYCVPEILNEQTLPAES